MNAASEIAGLSLARLERITEHIERAYIAPGKIAGVQIAIARHGELAYRRSFGRINIEADVAMADDAIFRIYSMTKPITSVALMTLYERGYFQLNDPVSRFFPEWKGQRVWVSGAGAGMVTEPVVRPPSMRDVLCHTSGLTYGTALVALGQPSVTPEVDAAYEAVGVRQGGGETLTSFMNRLAQVPLLYQPGERWMYSYATDVCGALVEKISGQSFDRYLSQTLFEPLGMKDTGFFVASEKVGRFCNNYARFQDKSLRLYDDARTSAYLKDPSFKSGGGGLVSTTADYLRFCEMLRRGGELDGARVLGPRTVALMHRNHLKGGRDLTEMAVGGFSETDYAGVGFGLGFAMTLDAVKNGGIGEGDYYWGGAASTAFWIDPVEDISVVFMTQLMPSGTFNFRGQLKSLIHGAIVSD
ncbi:MAG: serine hydrolase domain-containing protein [Caulobacteraceae bacterium]